MLGYKLIITLTNESLKYFKAQQFRIPPTTSHLINDVIRNKNNVKLVYRSDTMKGLIENTNMSYSWFVLELHKNKYAKISITDDSLDTIDINSIHLYVDDNICIDSFTFSKIPDIISHPLYIPGNHILEQPTPLVKEVIRRSNILNNKFINKCKNERSPASLESIVKLMRRNEEGNYKDQIYNIIRIYHDNDEILSGEHTAFIKILLQVLFNRVAFINRREHDKICHYFKKYQESLNETINETIDEDNEDNEDNKDNEDN